jgi:hypothetical protein
MSSNPYEETLLSNILFLMLSARLKNPKSEKLQFSISLLTLDLHYKMESLK